MKLLAIISILLITSSVYAENYTVYDYSTNDFSDVEIEGNQGTSYNYWTGEFKLYDVESSEPDGDTYESEN